MITTRTRKITVKDVADIDGLGSIVFAQLTAAVLDANFDLTIPDYLTSNTEKKIFKTGFLDELYTRLFPDWQRHEIFKAVTQIHHIFIDERQFQKAVKEYSEKKYVTFIKK